MKYLLICLVFSLSVLADSSGVVEQCKTVTLKVCKGEKAVVVRKKNKKKVVVVAAPVIATTTVTKIVEVDKTKKNIVFLYAQNKITELQTKVTGMSASTTSTRATVPGVGYQRLLTNGLTLGAGVDTQGDVQGQIGFNW